jgi:hypothetical protein
VGNAEIAVGMVSRLVTEPLAGCKYDDKLYPYGYRRLRREILKTAYEPVPQAGACIRRQVHIDSRRAPELPHEFQSAD